MSYPQQIHSSQLNIRQLTPQIHSNCLFIIKNLSFISPITWVVMTIYQMVLIKIIIPYPVPICPIFHFDSLKANNLKKYKKYRYYNILRQLNLFERMQKQVQLTKNYFTTIYNRKSAQSVTNPTLQILAFQLGPEESQSELIIRLSDGTTFLDCSLIGPFTFHNNKILHCHATKGMIQYRVHNLVKLNSIVIKDTINKICKIKLVVKDMDLLEDFKCIYGRPEELVQYLDNINITSCQDQGTNINKYALSLKNISFEEPNLRNSIKIQQQQKNQSKKKHKPSLKNTPNFTNIFQNPNSKNDPSFKDRLFQGQQILTGKEIIDGKAGIFIGRLLRMKMTSKQTKEGQLSVLILGFLDKTGEMVRINMAGRIAIKEFKQLKKQRCYFIKGLQIFQTDKMPHPLIKIKEKQFRINQVLSQNTPIVEMFQNSYFHWDHEINSIESERVDVIGIIQQIDDKIQHDYVQSQSQGQDKIDKHVVRIVVKNIAKTVRVSFWAEQISTYKNAQLRKRQAIILQDIRKKKNKFLDFTHQSSIIRLQNEKQLKQKFLHLLPDPLQQKPPSNINQITNFLNSEQQGTKNINLNLYLTQIDTNKMIYKSCIQCKRKVQKHNFCSFCPASIVKEQDQSSSFQYKYNCQLEFSDWSGSIYTVMFDAPALMLLGKNAKQISQLTAQQLQNLREDLLYRQYNVNVQNKNLRFILRNIQSIKQQNYPKISEKNVVMIQELKKNKKKQ